MLDLSQKTSNFYLRFVNGELEEGWNTLFHSASLPSFVRPKKSGASGKMLILVSQFWKVKLVAIFSSP